MTKNRTSLKKVLLIWFGIFVLLYLLLEISFFYYAPKIFPRAALDKVWPGAALLIQSSKNKVVPEHYIALLGDSYAYGQGDWLLEVQHQVQPVYSAAQLLHGKTGRDVISFGLPGSDSIRANNILPAALLQSTRSGAGFHVSDPDTIIVYFYEGNDLNDNVEVIEKKITPLLTPSHDLYNHGYFQNEILPRLIDESDISIAARSEKWPGVWYFGNFVKNTMVDFYVRNFVNDLPTSPEVIPAGTSTRISMAGDSHYLPDRLQTPALTLSRPEIDSALYVFEQSVAYLQKQFPSSRIGVAYLPSVITPYAITSDTVNDYYRDKTGGHVESSANIKDNSEYICNHVRDISQQLNIGFIDTRPRMREVAKNNFVHGPYDWNHFNKKGYETLTEDLLLLLSRMEAHVKQPLPACRWE